MITFNYTHTQQKKRLETYFIQELIDYRDHETLEIHIDFKLGISSNLTTKEEIAATLKMNDKKVLFKASKSRFKSSSITLASDIKKYIIENLSQKCA